MLFSKPISDLRFEDLEEFCKKFHENTRVEYKSTFDDSVKRKLAKVLSSFANSYGGILIIGINAPAGVPQAVEIEAKSFVIKDLTRKSFSFKDRTEKFLLTP